MKRLSFQWRVTLMTALLIALACVAMNLLLFQSGASSIDSLGEFVIEYNESDFPAEDFLFVDLSEEQFERFLSSFSHEISGTKKAFGHTGWLITAAVTLISAGIAYFASGHSLRPLREFTRQAEEIQAENLTHMRLNEDTLPEFRRLSRALNHMLDRIARSFAAQKQFTGNAAHELRTPLALMQAQLETCIAEHPKAAAEAGETLTVLQEQIERLSHLVKTLLHMSDMISIPRTDRIQLTPMIDEVLTDLAPLAEQKGILLHWEGEDACVTGSDVLIYRLIFNLVENAVKYNRPNGKVIVTTTQKNDAVIIRVRDTGPGIPEEYQESVFQPFFRVDTSRSRALGGVGLGLALAEEIARLHGGAIQVEESTKKGSVFFVRLPN